MKKIHNFTTETVNMMTAMIATMMEGGNNCLRKM